jgi:ABC-type nitrate/sulfonate/bicarbonate transport system permease component
VPWLRHLEPGAFPGPWETARRAYEVIVRGQPLLGHSVFMHTAVSLLRWGIGFALAAVLGILAGTALGRIPLLHRACMPLIYVLQLIPGLAWIPVTILLFGLGDGSTIFMITMAAFPPMVINVVAGMRTTPAAYLAVARMVGANRRTVFWQVLVPASIPHLLSGMRVALGNSWRVVVAAEMVVGAGTGLGYSIIQSRWTLDYAGAFVCIAVIAVIGLLTEHLLIVRIEQRTLQRWGGMA